MTFLKSLAVVAVFLGRYFRYWWFRRTERPSIYKYNCYEDVMNVLSPILGFHHIAVRNPERCPRHGPSLFCGNHLKLDDPFFDYRAVFLASEGEMLPRLMSRDDFFAGTIMKSRLIDGDELLLSLGTYLISRGQITLSQLKPFLKLLKDELSFVIFPGHTRSCSGVFVEYRGMFTEPGGVSFFMAHTQRSRPELQVAAVPVIRTYNPVSRRSAVVFGDALYLQADADREAQRAFDAELVVHMSQYLELNVPHVLAGLFYLRCLHGLPATMTVTEIREQAAAVFSACDHPYIDPEAVEDIGGAINRTLKFFEKHGALSRKRDAVTLNAEAILAVPDLTTKYRHMNPTKYLVNQTLHLGNVTDALQRVALAKS